jgi:hypothetical protein
VLHPLPKTGAQTTVPKSSPLAPGVANVCRRTVQVNFTFFAERAPAAVAVMATSTAISATPVQRITLMRAPRKDGIPVNGPYRITKARSRARQRRRQRLRDLLDRERRQRAICVQTLTETPAG